MKVMNDDNRSMYDLANIALEVQDACNLSGVVLSFSRDISRLRTLLSDLPNFSTEMLNKHPVCVLYSSKIASLTNSESSEFFHKAYEWCNDIRPCGGVLTPDNL